MSMLDWIPAIPTVLVAVAILVLPGAAVIIAGWGVDLRWLMAAPAVSIAIVAGSADEAAFQTRLDNAGTG